MSDVFAPWSFGAASTFSLFKGGLVTTNRHPEAFLETLTTRRGLPSGEYDLASGGHLVELADGDDVLDLGDEVVLLQPEQVDRCFAGVEAGAGVGDHLDELGDRRDVELFHLCLLYTSDAADE